MDGQPGRNDQEGQGGAQAAYEGLEDLDALVAYMLSLKKK
jgi:hypothetical protein